MFSPDNFNSFNLSNNPSKKSIFKKTAQPKMFARDSLFEIPNEDKIFEDEKVKSCIEFIHKLKTDKIKLNVKKEQKTPILYRLSPEKMKKIKIAKKMKDILDLELYQRNLILTASEVLSKDAVKNLETRFSKVRKKAYEVKRIDNMDKLFRQIKEEDDLTMRRIDNSYNRLLEFKHNKKDEKLPVLENKT
jgi:hypothetical protein